ncbi:MAG: DUF448 domain-containing protein [Campylobacter sp.]|nr:DUF448 domain-containing protein [Campylobacter sp.]
MTSYKHIPIRTCIVCRGKFAQNKLYRARYKNLNLMKNEGRSFYLCDKCIKTEDKILNKKISKFVKDINLDLLKESVLYGGSSDK